MAVDLHAPAPDHPAGEHLVLVCERADWTAPGVPADALALHRALPGYAPAPLLDVPPLADELGVGRVLVEDESSRLGLPASTVLGASWACR